MIREAAAVGVVILIGIVAYWAVIRGIIWVVELVQ